MAYLFLKKQVWWGAVKDLLGSLLTPPMASAAKAVPVGSKQPEDPSEPPRWAQKFKNVGCSLLLSQPY